MLSAQATLRFADFSKLRFFSAGEANELAEQVRKRNVFARHSWENNFYIQRVKSLADHTVIEVYRPGNPQDMGEDAEEIAATLEKITVLSSTLALNKRELQRRLGISSKPRTEIDFIISPQFRYLRSRTQPAPTAQGIVVDERLCKRFARCGFVALAQCAQPKSDISRRVSLSLDWLFDSRTEPRLPSSVVKTAIALESLLIFSESESLAQSLSERAAFVLSANPTRRQQTSRILKRFYDARSGVVHGSQKKARKLTASLLETVDRIAVMLCLVVTANTQLWPSAEALRDWCETQRWGEPSKEVKIPFPDSYLRSTLALGQKELLQQT